ncbi:membrane protein [Leisingera methylohalidivorans]|uniref:Membrane protein n=1 Tax=Leisingera methylohalidivorans DSM 14336 TaxID=999552 RepID=V9VQK7_9RHOB|nr:membrane protein [Leisingera methylohalidivorans]AHD01026.1 membrane protein [Leisingera methylohalidivorans DSM 14336]
MTRTAELAWGWFDSVILDLFRQLRWSFMPPLLIYFAYGAQGITTVAASFFVKEYLDFSAAFLAGLAFWVGLPWALKMPLGHLVDLIWRWKYLLILLGAGLMAGSYGILAAIVLEPAMMGAVMPPGAWYVTAALLAPCGYVLQDVVADAMSVEAVPHTDDHGRPLSEAETKSLHTTMQTFGRIALIGGSSAAAALNVALFDGADALQQPEKGALYGFVFSLALLIPVISLSGVVLAIWQKWRKTALLRRAGVAEAEIRARIELPREPVAPNHWYFLGGGAFVALSLAVGLGDVPYSQEIVFAGSMAIVLFLMRQLVSVLPTEQARALVGTAIIIFVYRATPLRGPGATWFEIDVLGFDQQFLSVLALITSLLTLAGMLIFRPMMASRPIAWIVAFLAITEAVLSLPNIALYYGAHHWTAAMTGGVVDARFIAIVDTAVESPLGQVAMIPMLAWIARNAPSGLKATFFAVMASFTNLALSASSLGTKYLNEIFVVTREVTDSAGNITTPADYSQLGILLITVGVILLAAPLTTIFVIQNSRFRTSA